MTLWGEPVLSTALAGGYLVLLTLMWLVLVLGVDGWGRRWTLNRPEGALPEAGVVKVSICIPARNEAENIEACVKAALASRWPNLEVVVVDDRSDDGTADLARRAGAGDSRLRVVEGVVPQDGWAGKPFACHRAAGESAGDLLLFLDADVRIDPDAVRALVGLAKACDLDMVSAFGTWELLTFWEQALIPTIGWLIRGAVNLDHVNDAGRQEGFANGQLILVRRSAHLQVGGHGAVADQVLDDVRLAEAYKRRGFGVGMVVAPWMFTVRLYRSFSEIIAGYSKNLYEGMGRRPPIGWGAVLFILVGTLLPFLLVLGGVLMRLVFGWGVPTMGWMAWLVFICCLQILFRWRVERRDGRPGGICWIHPIANAVLAWILVRSIVGIRTNWKGRAFHDGRALSAQKKSGPTSTQ